MSSITIVINTDNAAFDGGNGADEPLELACILRAMADRVLSSGILPAPKDSNGNTVGEVSYEGYEFPE
jgi:hypothetical protein